LDQIIVGWSTTEVFAVHNLRLREGQWLIDVTYAARKKTETKVIGAKLSWEKMSQLIPEAIFKKQTQQYITDSRIVSFVKLNVKTKRVDRSKGGYVSEVSPSSKAANGAILINIETGNEIAADIRRARIRNL
jgi:ribosomal protein L34E